MSDKPQRYISPKGVAIFPWLDKADTKWKSEGEYRCKLQVSADEGEKLVAKLQPLFDAAIEKAKKNPARKGKKIVEQEFFTMAVDEDGNETGDYLFNFKRTASGVSKKTGKAWAIKPDLFDAKGKKLPADVKIYGGSIVKVSFEVIPYDTPKATGIKLSLAGVQVLKLVEGNGRSAAQYGFEDESDDEDAEPISSDNDTTSSDDTEDADSGDAF